MLHGFSMLGKWIKSSLALVGKTVIFYHVLARVLGNDKRFGVELPSIPERYLNPPFWVTLRQSSVAIIIPVGIVSQAEKIAP
jgi:hypothetical protein